LKTQLSAKETVLDSNKDVQKQMQATIDGLTLAVEANSRTISELRTTEKSNEMTLQELRENQKQLQANIAGQTKTIETMKHTVQLLCGEQKDVSTREVEAIKTSKWAEIPPAINIANFSPNNVVCKRSVATKSGYVSEYSKAFISKSFKTNLLFVRCTHITNRPN
jgi:peptidoglycan hydrolase CwlO-like protein